MMRVRKEAMKQKKMVKGNDTEQPSESKDENTEVTPSVVKLQRLIGPSPAPRMLTPYEIELLRKCVEETAEVVREVLAKKKDASQRKSD